ncbi:unnamed protein product, partial [Mesorhabditis spiculigera]
MDRVKFAVVRVPEAKVIEFFATIASKGFTDVAFVNSLQQAAFTSLADEFLQTPPSPPPAATVSTNQTMPLNLSDLFPAVLAQANALRDASPLGELSLIPGSDGDDNTGRPYHQRMKGWQRTYLSEMLKDGYPTDEKLNEAMHKCDLSRRQILRFISKRVNNPNKGLRADWRAAKAHDVEKMIGNDEEPKSIKAEPEQIEFPDFTEA